MNIFRAALDNNLACRLFVLNMKLSVWSSFLKELSPEEAVKVFKSKGLDTMELSREHAKALFLRENHSLTARDFKNFLADEEFTLCQGHLPMLDFVDGSRPREHLDELKRQVEFYISLGVPNIVLHVGKGLVPPPPIPYEDLLEKRASGVRELSKICEGTGTYLCLENLVANMRTSSEIKDVIYAVGSPAVAVCYDSGHLNQTRLEGHAEFINNLAPYIRATHINDNEGSYEQHFLPFSLGLDLPKGRVHKVGFAEVVKTLKGIGYDGAFNFEVPGENVAPLPILLAKLDYIVAVGKYLISI